jgi:ABC-type transporter Mla maintaining outer membrane lipid asymmetry permease subunit MlaE
MCGWCTLVGIRRIESLDGEQLTTGFVYGLAMAIVWTSFGLMGGLFLGKFLAGVGNDFRLQELTVLYHDRLRDLGQLPDSSNGKPTV